jgi:cbb3-type cytochrome oxidase subunit 3
MFDLLTLLVKDGPQIGQEVPVTSDKTSLGGKGSGAEIELSGIPHGVQLAELKVMSGKWIITEYEPRSILLNGRQLKRKNLLKSGDEIRLPSLQKGQSIRYQVNLVAQKKQKEAKKKAGSGIKPAYLIGGVAYLVIFLMGMMYFAFTGSDKGEQAAQLGILDVSTALDEDIASINNGGSIATPNIALSDFPVNFDELKGFLSSDIGPERKAEVKVAFKKKILNLFSEAWRLEQQERWVAAKEQYETILATMADRNLATTNIALKRLRDLN